MSIISHQAGAYGIQGIGGCFVDSIKGCFYNVMVTQNAPVNLFRLQNLTPDPVLIGISP